MIDVAKLAHCIAEAQRQFGDSLQLTQIQQIFLIQPTHFAIFSVLWINSGGTETKKHKKPLAFGEKPNPVGT
ncbi:MAG: hypothetical protein SO115_01190 [Sodaliphilus sp.]|nr:hypothetical protein [Sodaliphilus sp.]